MILRYLATTTVAAVCLHANPADRPAPAGPAADGPPICVGPGGPGPTDLGALAASDPVAMLDAAARRYRADVRGFTAVLHKQERIAGTLHPPEELRVAVREDPYAVVMLWTAGARAPRVGGISLGGPVEGVLYAAGANNGNMTVWRPAAWIKTADVGPAGDQARGAARYALTEAGFGHASERTRRAWERARRDGRLRTEYLGAKPVPECGGRVCHVVRRLCESPEADPFAAGDAAPANPADAFVTVTIAIDADTWLQVGTELRRADGELIGAYHFRDVVVNPPFAPDQFTRAALRK